MRLLLNNKHFLKNQLLILICCLLSCVTVVAQSTVKGRVIDHAQKTPLANVNIFLSNATIGAQTNTDGTFFLKGIKPGTYELVISIVGFETQTQSITLNNDNLILPDIELTAKIIALHEVVVKPIDESERYWCLQTFKAQFLGATDLAADCKLLNPSVIDFEHNQSSGELKATSSDFIIIENGTLGYRIKYLLTDFRYQFDGINATLSYNGSVLFENLTGNDAQKKRWFKKRLEVYEGSEMHFLRSLLNNSLAADGFTVLQNAAYHNPNRPSDSLINAKLNYFNQLKDNKAKNSLWRDSLALWKKRSQLPEIKHTLYNFVLDRNEIFKFTTKDGIYALGCEFDGLYIAYDKRHPTAASSSVKPEYFAGNFSYVNFSSLYIFFDMKGWVLNPYSRTFSGAWGQYRVAGMLPSDYDPEEKPKLDD